MSPKTAFRGNYEPEKLVLNIFISQITLMLPRSLWFCFQCHNSRNAINHFAVCIRVLTLGTYVWLLWIFKWKIFSLKLHFSSLNKFADRRSNLACRPAWKRCVSCLWMTVKLWFWAWKSSDKYQEHEGYQCSTCDFIKLWFLGGCKINRDVVELPDNLPFLARNTVIDFLIVSSEVPAGKSVTNFFTSI